MFSLSLDCPQDRRDLLIAELWEAGVEGIVESDTGLQAFFADGADRAALRMQFPEAQQENAPERDWVAEYRNALQPMLVGTRFFLIPEWRDDATPEGRIRIRVNSGLAFGTGLHESTRLCLVALEELVRPGITVVDIGTGSGILAEAASKLGAKPVIACDLDPMAVNVARANFETAGLQIETFEGSIQKVRSVTAGLLVGNLSPEWLALLATEFARVVTPTGKLLLSGLEEHDVARVRAKLEQAGFTIDRVLEENSWRALICSLVN